MFICLLPLNRAFDLSNTNKKATLTDEARGVILLDSFAYPIVVGKHSPHSTFIFAMNKRDVGDYGTDSLRADYYRLALDFQKLIGESDTHKFLFAQVLVNGAINAKLGAKLGLTPTTKGPVYAFIRAGTDSDEVIPYTGRLDQLSLFAFVMDHTPLRVLIPGTDDRFNALAVRFLREFMAQPPMLVEAKDSEDAEEDAAAAIETAEISGELEAVLQEAKAQLQAVRKTDGEKCDAAILGEHYLKAMSKVARVGKLDVVDEEIDRLNHIMKRKEKAPPVKLREASQRRQVFMVFRAFIENERRKEAAAAASQVDEREL